MEKAWSHWLLNLWSYDENPVNPKKAYCQNWGGQTKVKLARAKREIAQIIAVGLEEAAFNRGIENDPSLWVSFGTKVEASWKYERRDY